MAVSWLYRLGMSRSILSHNLAFSSTFCKFPYARYIWHRFIMTSCTKNSHKVQILCSSMSSNVDTKVSLFIRGLHPKQNVTLQAKLCGESNDRYRSIAYYLADKNGQVNLNSQASFGGSYTGVEPMGFIWALKPETGQRPGRRLLKRDVSKPYLVNVALLLAAHRPDVAATVCVSGGHGLSVYAMYYEGKPLDYYGFMPSKLITKEDGSIIFRDSMPTFDDDGIATPVENIKGQLLVVYGADDQMMNTEFSATKIYERMKRFDKEAQCSLLGYHGAGHLIEPPYSPHANMAYIKYFDMVFDCGGETKPHAVAQEHFWAKTLTFFEENLPQKCSNLLS